MEVALVLFVILIILPAFFLLIFVTIPKSIRRAHMHSIAREFNLTFDPHVEWGWFRSNKDFQRNIVSGTISGHTIEICDRTTAHGVQSARGGFGYAEKRTIITIDGVSKNLVSYSFGFPSKHRIKKELRSILT